MRTTTHNSAPAATIQPASFDSGSRAAARVASGRQPAVQSQLDSASLLGHRFEAVGVLGPLTLGPSDDHYEREAGRAAQQVADQVGAPAAFPAMPAPRLTPLPAQASGLAANATGVVQRQAAGNAQASSPVPDGIAAGITAAQGEGQQLPARVRAPMEQAFNVRFDQVRVHTDQRARMLNQALGAKAFAVGQDIFFSRPNPLPLLYGHQQSDDQFDRLNVLGEELAHVVQQSKGGIRAIQRQDGRRPSRRRVETGSQRRWRRLHAGQSRRQPDPALQPVQGPPAGPANQPAVPPLDLSRLNRPAVPPLDLSRLNPPGGSAAPARSQRPAPARPSSAATLVGAADDSNAVLGPIADVGGSAATLADMSVSLPATSDSSWQGGGDAWSGGSTYDDYASADPSALGIAAGPLGFVGLTGFPGTISKQAEGIEDVFEGLSGPDKDYRRAIEGAGTVVETAASNYSTLLSATGAATNLAWTGAKLAGSGAAEGAGQVLTAIGQIAPGVGVATGGIGTIKGAYQGITAQTRMNALRAMAAQGNQSGTRRMLINYALENQTKQRNRAVVNTSSSALETAGSAISLSGVGAGIGASVSGSGLAVKYGAAGLRTAKQSLRDRRARRIASGQSGALGRLVDKVFDPDVKKTSALKNLKLDLMTEALVGGGAEHSDIFEAMGANKQNLSILRNPNRTPREHQQLTRTARELFEKRE